MCSDAFSGKYRSTLVGKRSCVMIRFICFVACEEKKKKERIDLVFSHVFSSFLFFFLAAYSFFFFFADAGFFRCGRQHELSKMRCCTCKFPAVRSKVFFFF